MFLIELIESDEDELSLVFLGISCDSFEYLTLPDLDRPSLIELGHLDSGFCRLYCFWLFNTSEILYFIFLSKSFSSCSI
jgi:hypothetical protein